MSSTMERFKNGDFNTCSQQRNADGTVSIVLTSAGDLRKYKAKVKDFLQVNEEVLKEETL